MSDNAKAAFFDGIAEKWDGWEDLAVLAPRLREGLREFEVGAGEVVLDVGCGTGNLTAALLDELSAEGRIEAVDISPRMIEAARRKISDARVTWHLADASRLPLADGTCDRAICYSVWPHFDDSEAVAREISRVLRPHGRLHVWHLISRERVNQIHADAGEAVCRDRLPPAEELARLLVRQGFDLVTAVEMPDRYLVTVTKPAR